jgi:hypothetical protein
MFCSQCGARLADGAAFCHSCGADVSASTVADGPSAPAGRRPAFWLVMAAVVLVAAGVGLVGGLLLGRSDDGSETGVAALPSTSTAVVDQVTPTASIASPEDVAQRWVQAQIDGDEAGFLELVRPDQREWADTDDLRGCDLRSAEVLVEEESIRGEVEVTIVFSAPCGISHVGDQRYKHCAIDLSKLSGRWYVDAASGCLIW